MFAQPRSSMGDTRPGPIDAHRRSHGGKHLARCSGQVFDHLQGFDLRSRKSLLETDDASAGDAAGLETSKPMIN